MRLKIARYMLFGKAQVIWNRIQNSIIYHAIRMKVKLIKQLIRFGLVGGVATLIHAGCFYVLYQLEWHYSSVLANLIAFSIAFLASLERVALTESKAAFKNSSLNSALNLSLE